MSYCADLDKGTPDSDTTVAITHLLRDARERATKEKGRFVQPCYDYELIAAFLDRATQAFRDLWADYLFGDAGRKQPWQTVKAFNRRMVWQEDGYKSLQPISELHSEITKRLSPYFAAVPSWDQIVTPRLQRSSIDALRQEFGQALKDMLRDVLLAARQGNWEHILRLPGRGSTKERAQEIKRIMSEIAPSLTDPDAAWVKDKIKELVVAAISHCAAKSV